MDKMQYSISELADKAGISVRTLRYYDQIGLLSPRRGKNSYRSYGETEVHRLQQIMLLRSCGLPLLSIKQVMSSDEFSLTSVLQDHIKELANKLEITVRAMESTKKVLNELEDFQAMNDDQRFEQLKQNAIKKFEDEFGEESRALYGDEVIDEANQRMLSMSQLAWDAKEELEERIKSTLIQAMITKDPASPESHMLAEMHAQWIRVHWGEENYTPEAHRQLVESYLHDSRFIEYYDGSCGDGATEFLKEAVLAHVK